MIGHKTVFMFYIISLYYPFNSLYKALNDANQKDTWTDLNFQQMFGQRMDSIQIFDNSTHKVGRNVLINRLNY